MTAEHDPRVCVGGELMDPTGCAVRACFDPGLFTERLVSGPASFEDLHRWQARAVIAALELAGHRIDIVPGARVTPERPYA